MCRMCHPIRLLIFWPDLSSDFATFRRLAPNFRINLTLTNSTTFLSKKMRSRRVCHSNQACVYVQNESRHEICQLKSKPLYGLCVRQQKKKRIHRRRTGAPLFIIPPGFGVAAELNNCSANMCRTPLGLQHVHTHHLKSRI